MKQVLKFCAIFVILGSLIGCVDPKDNPTGIPQRVVFWGKVGSQDALYISGSDDVTSYTKIIDTTEMIINAKLSPHKDRVLWTENDQMKAVNIDGTGLVTWPITTRILNAEWADDSDTILFEPIVGREIRKTKFSDKAVDTLVYSGVSGLSGTADGFNIAFFVIANATVHNAMSLGGGEYGWDSEPIGTDVANPVLSFDEDEVAYQAFDGSKYVLRTSNGSGIKTVSTTEDMDYHWSPQVTHDGNVIATHVTTAGPGNYTYYLTLFKTNGTTELISQIDNNTISRPDLNAFGNAVIFTRGNELIQWSLQNGISYTMGAGLDRAGYADAR